MNLAEIFCYVIKASINMQNLLNELTSVSISHKSDYLLF